MKVIISPAKNMSTKADALEPKEEPVFIQQAQKLVNYLKSLPFEQLKTLLACNEKLAQLNYQRYQSMDLHSGTNPALVSYEGIQYQYMAPKVFTYEYFDYAQEHVRILSGLYGILRPFDAIVPYRLEMQAKLKTDFCKNLYDFWGASLYQELTKDSKVIINLASDEYSKAIKKYVQPTDSFITCRFCEQPSWWKREYTSRWLVGKWYAIWQSKIFKNQRLLKISQAWAMGLVRSIPRKNYSPLCDEPFILTL